VEVSLADPLTFIVSDIQLALDHEQVAHDLLGSRAQARTLRAAGVMTPAEEVALAQACDRVAEELALGTYGIDPGLGAHLSLERRLTELAGSSAGGKIHTGRSRNDQVLVTGRLWLRDQLLALHARFEGLLATLLEVASEHTETVMPGYTHMQPAKPTTLAHFLLAYHEMFARDLQRLEEVWERFDACPLGAAESFGSAWSLDRELTARLLGFARVEANTAAAVGSRGECEAEVLGVLAFFGLHVSKLAQDLLLLTTHEYRYLSLSEAAAPRKGAVTGSSIMPQKKNPDVFELLRAAASKLYALHFEALEVLKGLPLGYNRDSRETKESIARGLAHASQALEQLRGALPCLLVDKARMLAAVRANYSMATDLADGLARHCDLPFRQVYHLVGDWVKQAIAAERSFETLTAAELCAFAATRSLHLALDDATYAQLVDPIAAIRRRDTIGSPAPHRTAAALDQAQAELAAYASWRRALEQRVQDCRSSLEAPLKTHP
jgi:argininosuccinate lyase